MLAAPVSERNILRNEPFHLSETLCHKSAFVFLDPTELVEISLEYHLGLEHGFPFWAIHQLPDSSCDVPDFFAFDSGFSVRPFDQRSSLTHGG